MKKLPIAAVSALAALAFSACATSSPSLVKYETETVEALNENQLALSNTPSVTTPVEVQTVKPNETLLYGAMTKYELMTFVKAIQNANLQTALESNDPMTIFRAR